MGTVEENAGLVILIPVFNDGPAVGQLLKCIDSVLLRSSLSARVLLVDDASLDPLEESIGELHFEMIQRVEILALRRNLGHQRAIAIGLTYVEQSINCGAILIMDGDGEDSPEDIPRLLEKYHAEKGRKVVFAARMKRSESWLFLVLYHLYRFTHLLLTGINVRVGNFSIVPFAHVRRLVVVSELWNHYAAAVFFSRIPYTMIPTQRASRLAGQTHMNFVSLVVQGLSAISVFGEHVGVRLMLSSVSLTALIALGLAATLFLGPVPSRVNFTPGFSTVAILQSILLFQGLIGTVTLIVTALNLRSNANFLPIRDYAYFVDKCKLVFALRANEVAKE